MGAHLVGETSAAGQLVQLFDQAEPMPANPPESLCDFAVVGGATRGTIQI